MDVHVHRAITIGLRRRNVDVLTAQEDGSDELEDPDLLQRATKLGRVLFTQDHDFLDLPYQLLAQGIETGGAIYTAQERPIGVCVEELHLMSELVEPSELANLCVKLPDFLL